MSSPPFEKDFVHSAELLGSWSKKTEALMAEKWAALDEQQRSRIVWNPKMWGRPRVMEGLAGLGVDLSRWHCPSAQTGHRQVKWLLTHPPYSTLPVLTGLDVRKIAFWMNVSPVTQAALTRAGVPTGSEEFSVWVKSASDHGWLNSFEYACAADLEQIRGYACGEFPILAIAATLTWLKKPGAATEAIAKRVLGMGADFEQVRFQAQGAHPKEPEKLARLELLLSEVRAQRLATSLPVARSSTPGPRF